tara:strand:- start:885 stop:1622 length:738 start_codon:yes stop_codon:yes gene_type:complete
MINDWIKLKRDIRKHWIYQDSDYFKFWIDMCLEANWKLHKSLYKGKLIDIKRGSFPMSYREWAQRWNTSEGKVRRLIKLLKDDKMITTDTTHGFTLVKICNYDKYQGKNDKQTDTVTDRQTDTVTDTQTDTTIRRKERKERKNTKVVGTTTLLSVFGQEYKTAVGVEYNASFAKEGKLLKDLEKQYGYDQVVLGIKYFFTNHIKYDNLAKKNPTVGGMKYAWNGMVAKAREMDRKMTEIDEWIHE